MGKKFLQATILTLLLQLLALISSPTVIESNSLPSWRTDQTPLAILLHRIIRLQQNHRSIKATTIE